MLFLATEPEANLMVARYYSAGLARFMAVDPGDDTDPMNPQSWNKYAYVRNNPLRNVDPTGQEYVGTTAQQLEQDARRDPNLTDTERKVVENTDASELKVGVNLMNEDAAVKIGAPGATISPGGELGSGELFAAGDPEMVEGLAQKGAAQGSDHTVQYEAVSTDVPAPLDAAMVIFGASHDLAPVAGAVTREHAVLTTFVHGSAHLNLTSGTIRPEPEVKDILRGTPSE